MLATLLVAAALVAVVLSVRFGSVSLSTEEVLAAFMGTGDDMHRVNPH